ncbi:TPM domain-containing protein [Luteolibacter sp. SL250]|uniref:TPM domain-containing protein n=1 Tax=Luteolibacter sp. SL250 TaxID=2995170 RepID=UPI00226DC70F|nr:TPM domain-containing protein [Luteolibacter sp. SL250]WAC19303.1 TPM domain-containing protein [Luteolibacter sp. SL250]
MNFPRTSTLLGAMPRLSPGVSDTTGKLTSGETGKLRKRVTAIQRRFPQLVLQVVMRAMPEDHPFSLYAFWLFNAGAFAGEGRRGANNHAILLLIDPARQESALIPGYGLEPLLKPEALGHLLDLAGPVWEAGLWMEGIERVLAGLEKLLESVGAPEETGAINGEF